MYINIQGRSQTQVQADERKAPGTARNGRPNDAIRVEVLKTSLLG